MAWARTPSRLLGGLVWGAGLLSALVTNDAVCVIGAPLVVAWVERHRLPALPFLLALATAANTGSVATLVGNPQNMLCATLGGLGYRSYLVHMLPVALVGLAVNHVILVTAFRRELAIGTLAQELPRPAPRERRAGVTLAVVALTVVIYLAGGDLAFTALGGFTALLLVHRADPTTFWARIDWSVLVFFAGLFVAVECLVASGAAAAALARFPIDAGGTLSGWVRVAVVFLVGSNVVSNVPFILVVKDAVLGMSNPTLAWELLAMASTFAGNLTLLGSVANIIVAERGRTLGGLPFFAHLRIGFPLTLVTTALGTAWLLWLHGVR